MRTSATRFKKARSFLISILLFASLPALTQAQEEGGATSAQDAYVGIDEPMIVNVLSTDSIHFLQITTEFKLKDPTKAAMIQAHLAPLKHNLIMLFSEKKFFELQSVEGKRKLREEALAVVQATMKEKTGDTLIENIFFTSLVIQ